MVAAVCTVTNVGRSTKCEEFLDRLSSSSQARRSLLHGVSKGHPITGHEGPEVEERYSSTLSLTSALEGGGWSTPRPGRFNPWERPGTHCIGGRVDPRAGLDRCG